MTDSIVLLADLHAQFDEEYMRMQSILNDRRGNMKEKVANFRAVFTRLYDIEKRISLREGREIELDRLDPMRDMPETGYRWEPGFEDRESRLEAIQNIVDEIIPREPRVVCTSNKGVRTV